MSIDTFVSESTRRYAEALTALDEKSRALIVQGTTKTVALQQRHRSTYQHLASRIVLFSLLDSVSLSSFDHSSITLAVCGVDIGWC